MLPVAQQPPWRDGSLCRCLLYVTHLLRWLFLGETEPNTAKTHHHYNSSIHNRQQHYHLWRMWTNGASPRQHRPRFMWPCQRQVNYCYTGRWALCPFPGQHKHSEASPVSGSSVCSVENWSLSLMLAAGTGRQSYFLPFAIVSCYSYVHNTMHLIHTVFAFVCL